MKTTQKTPGTLRLKNGSTVRGYPLPPKGFDPRRANPKLLAKHGFPRRPDGHNELMSRWEALVVGIRRVNLSLEQIVRPPTNVDGVFAAPGGAPHFCGTSVAAPFGYDLSWIAADWTVPNFYEVTDIGGANALVAITNGSSALFSTSGVSVGTDFVADSAEGASGPYRSLLFSGQVIGALTDLQDAGDTGGLFFAGFDDPGHPGLRPGDLVSVLVCLESPTAALVYFVNRTLGVGGSARLETASARPVHGTTAHWHVERIPGHDDTGHFLGTPRFGRLYFSNAIAFAQAAGSSTFLEGRLLEAGEGEPIQMLEPRDGNRVVCSARVVDRRTLEISSLA